MPFKEDFFCYLHFSRERGYTTKGQRRSARFWSGGKDRSEEKA